MGVRGLVISGKFAEIVVREKSGEKIELGELLIAENNNSKILLQVYDLIYGSQISQSNLELVSGMKLEEDSSLEFMDEKLRSYNLALLKNILTLKTDSSHSCKSLPDFFSGVREVTKNDLRFLTKPEKPIFLGKLRSGSKTMDVSIFLPSEKVFSHHILIPAATGKGKSNLASCMLWDSMKSNNTGILVLDPHDEYFGRHSSGLKEHPEKENLVYYTSYNPPAGSRTLKINIKNIMPGHFNGVTEFSLPQKEAINAYYRRFKENWVEAVVKEKEIGLNFHEGTLSVVRRRLISLLDLELYNNKIICNGVFDISAGETTLKDICNELEKGKLVIIDTSNFPGNQELLIGSLITNEIFKRYKRYKNKGQLKDKPVVSVLIEEAPRVLGKEILEKGPNIFSTIAREGRKFKVGLTAITQLPSLIPREILANMNTKIILGIEMNAERQAIIDSAAQDLSSDSRAIAALDKGEAIITSNFTRFAIPVKIPLFSEFVKKDLEEKKEKEKVKQDFSGINLD
ncbi:ATP-binding protein [Candidatus Woesearchaeota archaeon]|nr:ATP-binding protein [Candidatus Woesearchaeota archaeon]